MIHLYVIELIVVVILILLIIQLSFIYQLKHSCDYDIETIKQSFLKCSKLSITADDLMTSDKTESHFKAFTMVNEAIHTMETLLILLPSKKQEELVHVDNPIDFIKMLKLQEQQIIARIQYDHPTIFKLPFPHRAHSFNDGQTVAYNPTPSSVQEERKILQVS